MATDSITTRMVLNELNNEFEFLYVAFEKPISRKRLLKKRLAKLGFLTVLGQLIFMAYTSIIKFISKARINSLIGESGFSYQPINKFDIQIFDSVNSEACIEWVKQIKPDVVVLNGTRIVSSDLLNSCDATFINTHCGITPAYRGVHGGYWALVNNDAKNAGVTIHVVDTGIDTGDIVFQKNIKVSKSDNFLIYPVKQYIEGIPLLKKAIRLCLADQLRTFKRDDLISNLWYHPTIWEYFYNFIRFRVK
ncbi:formyl transferase [Thiomicrorhabdus chilensis]|uniref:formyl transferase n=1 Tax=Thiomicrorhabdus chilensis TaxID=63656 RepID=UPI0012FD2B27|nr:formyl transferase [Thiomicrorhabdus chilensis]